MTSPRRGREMRQRSPRWLPRRSAALAGIGLRLALDCAAAPASAQTPDPPSGDRTVLTDADLERTARDAQLTGGKALPEFALLVTPDNYRGLGFESPDEARRAVLGAPIPVFSVRLDELGSYSATAGPAALLHGWPQYFLPVEVGASARALIEVARVDNTWKTVRFGSPQIIRTIQATRAAKANELHHAANTFFVVRILALRLTFVAHRDGAQLFLTPTSNAPRYQLGAGKTLPAEVVFQQLAPYARNLDTRAPS
jgi:hypothetical protein